MFVAVLPPDDAVADLEEFLEPRRDAQPDARWTGPEQWHVTLAFLAQVADRHLDDLTARLERAASRRTPGPVRLAGGGAFPDPARAKVLYAGVEADDAEGLRRLAVGARSAAAKAGTDVAGGRFHPHVTLARLRRPLEATRWTRVLETYRGPTWTPDEVALVASYLGEGPRRRPRYETVATFPLGRRPQGGR